MKCHPEILFAIPIFKAHFYLGELVKISTAVMLIGLLKKKKRVGSHPFVSHQESPGILNCNYLLAGPGLGWGEWGAWGTEFKRTFILRAVPSVVCASINLYPRHFTHFNLILVLPNSQKSIKLIIWIWIESKLRTWFIYGPLKCSEILH